MTANPHQYYDSFAEELSAKFRRVGHLVAHRGASGTYHEELLRVVLRNFLSRRYSVKTGFVYKNEAEVSFQVDVLVIDEHLASAYLYQEGEFAIVRPEAVVAAVEVKTILDASSFGNALENIASVRRLSAHPEDICGMVFGYEGTPPTPQTLGRWFERPQATSLASTPELGPTLISFFRHGVLLVKLDFEGDCQIDENSPNYHPLVHIASECATMDEKAGGWQLRHILALIYAACASRTGGIPQTDDVDQLLQFSGAVPGGDHYVFGTGFVPRQST